MSKIFMKDQAPAHFLVDSDGNLYQVSKEIAEKYAAAYPGASAVVDHVDTKTNTIWFTSPLPAEVASDVD